MFTKIAVATDGSPLAEKAVQTAAGLAATCQSELIVLHVLMHGEPPEALKRMVQVEHLTSNHPQLRAALDNVPSQMMSAQRDVERHRIDHEIIAIMGGRILDGAKTMARELGVASVTGEVLEGESVDQIVDAAKRADVDLIVLGTRGLGPLKSLVMGSVSQKVAQRAQCACLIVK